MRWNRWMALGMAGLAAACGSSPTRPAIDGRVALTGVTVVDGTGAPPRSGVTVVMDSGRIVSIVPDGEADLGADTEVLELAGRWVVPGLIDVHVHMPGVDDQPRFLSNLLGFGVTTARSTAAAPDGGTELRARLESGAVLGPRFVTAGRLIDAPGSGWGGFAAVAASEAEIREQVRLQAAQGVDLVKLYAGLEPALVRAAIDEAHGQGLPVLGHLGRTSWGEAVAAGIDGLTHGCMWGMASSVVPQADSARFAEMYQPHIGPGFDPGLIPEWAGAVDLEAPRFVELATAMADRRVSWDPNLVICEAVLHGDDAATLARLQPEFDVDAQPFPHPYSSWWPAGDLAAARATFPTMLSVVGALHDRGVLLTLGSDTRNPWMTPGAAALRELELLVQAGLTPAEALVVGTRNGAEALGLLDETGTLEVGKAADLLVLTADPTADISAVRQLEWVATAGRVYDPSILKRRR